MLDSANRKVKAGLSEYLTPEEKSVRDEAILNDFEESLGQK